MNTCYRQSKSIGWKLKAEPNNWNSLWTKVQHELTNFENHSLFGSHFNKYGAQIWGQGNCVNTYKILGTVHSEKLYDPANPL